jgi:hypothetical protein
MKTNAYMLSVEGSELEFVPHFGCLSQSVIEFISVASIWCEAYSQGLDTLCDFDPLDCVTCV